MQEVFSNTSKVLVDGGQGNNLLYLPLDKLMGAAGAAVASDPTRQQATTTTPSPSPRGAATDDYADTRREALRSRDRDALR